MTEMRFSKFKIFFLTLFVLSAAGCKKWLEIEPKAEVAADVLYETPEGFGIALNGIYTSISDPQLYSRELKFNFIDVLARVYDTRNSAYEGLKTYDYVSDGMDMLIQGIWASAFSAIANCNALLQHLDEKPADFFSEHERNMLEGEARSIRAMLYLDLLRLFAPAPVVEDAAAIPYYGTLSNEPRPNRRTSEILGFIIEDLKESQRLQRPFDTSQEATDNFRMYRFNFERGFYGNSYRGFRMGYYATTALLARAALYAGDDALALQNATELINERTHNGDPTIDLTPGTRMDVGAFDRLLSEDIIFGLYRMGYETQYNNVIFLTPNSSAIFGSDLHTDYRKRAYYTTDGQQVLKFDITLEREGNSNPITSVIPMIRLSEMYHIAAEASYDTDPEAAVEFLNTLRAKRGVNIPHSSFASKDAFLDAIINDGRREYVGEGQLFFLYKRLNKTVLDEAGGDQHLTEEFVLPIPEREVSLEN